jgi:diguanylate cyclase (GGDEF)-like protein/PAS domain S-box-containing protein
MFKPTIIAVILFSTTAINFLAFYISWQRRNTRSGLYFALGMLAITLWTLAAGLDYAAVPISLKFFFSKLEYAGSNSAIAFFILFVLSYVGYEDWLGTRLSKILVVCFPVSNIVLAWTNDLHWWLWPGYRESVFGDNTIIFEHGPGIVWVLITGYLMMTIIIVLLWQASRRGSELSRRQARLLFWASLVPVAGNLIYLLQSPKFKGIDWSSISFSIAGILFLLALYSTGLLDLAPVARDKLISSLSDGMIVLDTQNRIIEINHPAIRMIEMPDTTLIGKDLSEVAPLTRSFLEQAPEEEIKTEVNFGTTNKRYFDVLVSPLYKDNHIAIGRLIIFRDITKRKQAQQALQQANQQLEKQLREIESLQASLREQAIRDPLTQLYNRRFLSETIEHEFHRAQRLSQPLSIVMLDIDHFKVINDTYGHATGDAYLVMLANALQQQIRKSDIVCRYGGEEFLLVLPDTAADVAAQLAEKLRLIFADAVQVIAGQEIKTTISMGIASYPAHGTDYNEIINKADRALYISKHKGRDQVTIWSDIPYR